MADTDNAVISTSGEVGRPVESCTAKPGERSGALSCLLPTFSEACKLVNSSYSCLVVQTHRRPLALSPRNLNKKKSGIQEQLNGELLKYSARLEGVPLAYDNVKIVGEFGDIHDDAGYIHLNVQADFVIFQPMCGEKLVGIVNKVAPSHIGCLVHGCFNASIPKPFKMPIEAWQHVGLTVGDHVEFEVFRLDSDAVGVFCIRGKMDKKMEMKAIERLNEETKEQTSEVSCDTEKTVEDGEDTEPKVIPEDTPKKKAKKRAFHETLLQNVPGNSESSGEMNTTLEEIPKKKSRKRKHQEINSQADVVEVDASLENIPVEDSAMKSLYQPDDISKKVHKKKKRPNSLPSVDIDNNDIKVEESSILGFDNAEEHSIVAFDYGYLVPSSQEHPKKSKKKKHKDRGLNESLQNGITERQAEYTVLEDLGAEAGTVQENLKKKHKKKHKQSSTIENILDSTDGGADVSSQGSLVDNLLIYQETPRKKKHKRKHLAVLAGGDDAAYLAEDRLLPLADSQEFSEPKAKKRKRTE
ncbi:DNA-directed RNA polymerase I subunit RPA43 [Mantella aurantiaca]